MLTQTEADTLIAMAKSFVDRSPVSIHPGSDQTRDLIGADPRERFLIDMARSSFRLTKSRLQTRGRKVFVLVRLDIDGAPHTNPDGVRLGGTHLHLYREGFEDRWARPLDPKEFPAPGDLPRTFEDFCRYCNIEDTPFFQAALL